MKVQVQIVHEIPGRVRVRLPDILGNAELAPKLEDMLVRSHLFQSVRMNPVTASMVLEFEGRWQDVLEQLRPTLPFELELKTAPALALSHPRKQAADPLRLVSGRDVNAMFLVGTLFGAVGLIQTFRGRILMPALGAFWYAGAAFRRAQKPAATETSGAQ